MSTAEPAGQRRVVAVDRLQTGVVGQVTTARRETASRRRGIPSGRCGITRRGRAGSNGRGARQRLGGAEYRQGGAE